MVEYIYTKASIAGRRLASELKSALPLYNIFFKKENATKLKIMSETEIIGADKIILDNIITNHVYSKIRKIKNKYILKKYENDNCILYEEYNKKLANGDFSEISYREISQYDNDNRIISKMKYRFYENNDPEKTREDLYVYENIDGIMNVKIEKV